MCKINMIRGYNDKIFFAEQFNNDTGKIVQLECLRSSQDTVKRTEILALNGGKVLDLDTDGQNV